MDPVSSQRHDPHHDEGVTSNAAIGGHPLHPMMVPFPIAFLGAALGTDLAFRATRDPFWARSSSWLLLAGAGTGVAAGALGAIDYMTIGRARRPAGHAHAAGNLLAIGLAALNWGLRRRDPVRGAEGGLALGLSAATAGILGVTGWLGGELSYRHKIGVVGHEAGADQRRHRTLGHRDRDGGGMRREGTDREPGRNVPEARHLPIPREDRMPVQPG